MLFNDVVPLSHQKNLTVYYNVKFGLVYERYDKALQIIDFMANNMTWETTKLTVFYDHIDILHAPVKFSHV